MVEGACFFDATLGDEACCIALGHGVVGLGAEAVRDFLHGWAVVDADTGGRLPLAGADETFRPLAEGFPELLDGCGHEGHHGLVMDGKLLGQEEIVAYAPYSHQQVGVGGFDALQQLGEVGGWRVEGLVEDDIDAQFGCSLYGTLGHGTGEAACGGVEDGQAGGGGVGLEDEVGDRPAR